MAEQRRDRTFPLRGTAVVTGASSGLGTHYAEFLARAGMDLVLVARRVAELEEVAATIAQRHGRQATVLPTDLTDRAARADLVDQIAAQGITVDVLINNAGFGTKSTFAQADPDRVMAEIELNCVALTDLTRAYLPGMLERNHGAIVNVASTAGFQPIPGLSVYAATKAYVRSFSQGLWSETRDTGVRVLSVCPGPTETEFMVAAGAPDMMPWRRTPEQVVQSTFRALNKNAPEVVDGPLNRGISLAAGLIPTRLMLPIARGYTKG